jgi:myosin heavy subunit
LRNLVARYANDDIFTYIGPTLIVVNPYRIIEKYINLKVLADIRNSVLNGSPKGDPHIYRIAGRAYQSLVSGEGKQAIIISG